MLCDCDNKPVQQPSPDSSGADSSWKVKYIYKTMK